MTRLYLPATVEMLRALAADQPLVEVATRIEAGGDDEDLEYAALLDAAVESAEVVGEGERRIVIVAEVAAPTYAVRRVDVVAIHADTAPGAEADDDLCWFATQEIAELVESFDIDSRG